MECIICAENNKKKLVNCEYCDFQACVKCTKTYILSVTKPGCMSTECTGEWSRKFIQQNFSLSFVNDKLQKHRKEILFQKQLGLMPATQLIIEEENRQRKLKIELNSLDLKIRLLHNSIAKDVANLFDDYNRMCYFRLVARNILISIKKNSSKTETWSYLKSQLKAITPTSENINDSYAQAMSKKLELIKNTIQTEVDVLTQERNEVYHAISRKVREISNFVMKCGNSDCKGFLNNHWNCGLCEKKTCKDCYVVGEHETCDPDSIATVKLLKSDTKNCPGSGCNLPIFKIDGCDQMWCVKCKTAFSWRTGSIETKIHNPHYYQWRRDHGTLEREPNDIPLGDCNQQVIDHHFSYFMPKNDVKNSVDIIVMRLIHINESLLANRDNNEDDFRKYRLQYLKNQTTETQLKTQCIRKEKAQSMRQDVININQLIVTTVTDILFRFRHKSFLISNLYDVTILDEIPSVVQYANECFIEISKTYNCKYYHSYNNSLKLFSKQSNLL